MLNDLKSSLVVIVIMNTSRKGGNTPSIHYWTVQPYNPMQKEEEEATILPSVCDYVSVSAQCICACIILAEGWCAGILFL